MRCRDCREALSARLDGESEGAAAIDTDDHLVRCSRCQRFLEQAEALNRRARVRAAEPIPDLRSQILGPSVRGRSSEGTRCALFAVALTALILATPSLLGTGPHASRDLAAFEVALGLSLLFASWRPERAPGLLPMGAPLVGAVVLSSVVDIGNGRVPAATEAGHVLELVGILLLWRLARRRAASRSSVARSAGSVVSAKTDLGGSGAR